MIDSNSVYEYVTVLRCRPPRGTTADPSDRERARAIAASTVSDAVQVCAAVEAARVGLLRRLRVSTLIGIAASTRRELERSAQEVLTALESEGWSAGRVRGASRPYELVLAELHPV